MGMPDGRISSIADAARGLVSGHALTRAAHCAITIALDICRDTYRRPFRESETNTLATAPTLEATEKALL